MERPAPLSPRSGSMPFRETAAAGRSDVHNHNAAWAFRPVRIPVREPCAAKESSNAEKPGPVRAADLTAEPITDTLFRVWRAVNRRTAG